MISPHFVLLIDRDSPHRLKLIEDGKTIADFANTAGNCSTLRALGEHLAKRYGGQFSDSTRAAS